MVYGGPALGAYAGHVACQIVATFDATDPSSPSPTLQRAADESDGWVGSEEKERDKERTMETPIAMESTLVDRWSHSSFKR